MARKTKRVSMLKKYSLRIDTVNFVHICYIQCDLFDCYTSLTNYGYGIMSATLSIHSCSFYKVVQ